MGRDKAESLSVLVQVVEVFKGDLMVGLLRLALFPPFLYCVDLTSTFGRKFEDGDVNILFAVINFGGGIRIRTIEFKLFSN